MRKPRNESNFKQKLRRAFLAHPLNIYKTVSGKLLTHDATRVLVCCIYDIDDMFYFGHNAKAHFLDAYLGGTMNHVEIFSALSYLEELHLIENLSGTPDSYTFNMTHEGIHFFELRHRNYIYLALNSLILPIIIAIATTLTTLALNGLV